MPLYDNVELLAEKIINCNNELDSLFVTLDISQEFKKQLQKIKSFYARAFNKTLDEESGLSIVEEYEQFIIAASEVKLGHLTADKALELIQNTTDDRQCTVVIDNILKICELLFWTAAAAISYATCLTIGLPLFFLQPLLGIAITAGTGILFFAAVDIAGDCFEEFKSFDPINNEHTREKNVISFFSPLPSKPKTAEAETNTETQEQTAGMYPLIA